MDVTVSGIIPQAEYMYGCVPTSVGMLLAYYAINGYKGADGKLYDVSALFDGTPEANSRGLDGNIYDMDAFDTVVGSTIASERHVSEFWGKTPEEEYQYTFVQGTNEIDMSRWDCLADYLGTNQFWRGRSDTASGSPSGTLEEIIDWDSQKNISYGDINITIDNRMTGWIYGLYLFVETKGFSLDIKHTGQFYTDNWASYKPFSFEDYMAQIDAGHPVIVGITGHAMFGYGYDEDTREIIFDDTYRTGQRMKWDDTYYYSGKNRTLQDITVINFDLGTIVPEVYGTHSATVSGTSITISNLSGKNISEYEIVLYRSNLSGFLQETTYHTTKETSITIAGLKEGIYRYEVYGFNSDYEKSEASRSVTPLTVTSKKITANNSIYYPTSISAEESISIEDEWIGREDTADYYYIDRVGTLRVAISGVKGKLKVTLYDANKKKVKSVTTGSSTNVFGTPQVGSYISVESADKGKTSTNYSLRITGDYFPEPTTNDDTLSLAAPEISLDASGAGTLSGWVGMGDPADIYKFNMSSAGTFALSISGVNAKLKVSLYNANFRKIKSVSLSGNSPNVFKTGILLQGGYSYIGIESGDKGKGKQNSSYTLNISNSYFPAATTDDDAMTETTPTLLLDESGIGAASGWVGYGDAIDCFRLEPSAASVFRLSVSDVSAGAQLKITLYGADGKKLANASIKGDNSNVFKKDILLPMGTAFIAVESGDKGKGKQNSNYTLNVTENYFPARSANADPNQADVLNVDGAGLSDWIGFGNKTDYFKFTLEKETKVQITGNFDKGLKLTMTDISGKKVSLGKGFITSKELSVGTYQVSVDCGNEKKNSSNFYNIGIASL